MRTVDTQIEIAAPAERVWNLLTDFGAFPDWNPFMRRVEGAPIVGTRLEVTIQPPGRGPTTFKPTVLEADANHQLGWLGRLLFPGVFDGRHTLTIQGDDGGRSVFRQREVFTGILVPFLAGMLHDTERGFVKMNEALKQRAEAAG
jgi:hypothetical protein